MQRRGVLTLPSRRRLLAGAGAAGAGLITGGPLWRAAMAACASIGQKSGVGDDFPGGLETRNGVNIGYYPFRVCSPAGGTFLYSGDWAPGLGGRRLAWLPNGVEFSLQSLPNAGACSGAGNCGSNSPAMRPPRQGFGWGYAEGSPALAVGAPKAPTQDQGWVSTADLLFVGYEPHTTRLGPACRDFEVHSNPTDGKPISKNGLPSTSSKDTCGGPNVACDAVNSCHEGDDDCQSDYGDTQNFGENSQKTATCLGGYEFSPYVPDDNSPDMPKGSVMPLSYLFFAPRSNTKMYLHQGDKVRVLWRRTMWIGHGDGSKTKSTWYGVEVLSSSCPVLSPVGVRGWVMAFSEYDHDTKDRGQFFSEVL